MRWLGALYLALLSATLIAAVADRPTLTLVGFVLLCSSVIAGSIAGGAAYYGVLFIVPTLFGVLGFAVGEANVREPIDVNFFTTSAQIIPAAGMVLLYLAIGEAAALHGTASCGRDGLDSCAGAGAFGLTVGALAGAFAGVVAMALLPDQAPPGSSAEGGA